MIRGLTVLMPILFIGLLAGCSDRLAGGGGVDTETSGGKLAGTIFDGSKPAARVTVTLYPADFDPVKNRLSDSSRMITGYDGQYRFENVRPGRYNIQAVQDEGGGTHLRQDIVVPDAPRSLVEVSDGHLTKESRIVIHKGERFFRLGGYFYIPGTGNSSLVTSESIREGFLTIDRVSPANYSALLYTDPDSVQVANLLPETLIVASDTVVVLGPYHGWPETARLLLNTTASGSGLEENVHDFPLLLRLDGTQHPALFAGAGMPALRFTKADGLIPLPYEIEHWDAGLKKADIWVKLDTLHANDNTRHILMHWDPSRAESISNSAAVFDTSSGYLSVWHFGEGGNSLSRGISDATAAANNGTGARMGPSATATGAVGNGLLFAGDTSGITAATPPYLKGDVSFSLSFWMKPGLAAKRSWLLFLGVPTDNRGMHWLVSANGSTAHFGAFDNISVQPSPNQNLIPLSAWRNDWVHVATTYDAGTKILRTYFNGLQQAENTVSLLNLDPQGLLTIGLPPAKYADEAGFSGLLDEVRLEKGVRTRPWIKLNYESQKSGGSLVRLE